LKENNCQPRTLHPEKPPVIIGEIKAFHDKQKLKQLMTTKSVLQKTFKQSYTQKRKTNATTKM
jgi:hypothetical protein